MVRGIAKLPFLPRPGVLRQRLDNEVEPQPETPAVMIKSDWKKQRHHEQQNQHALVINAHYQQKEEAEQQNYQLRNDDVGQNRADEETFFTFEQRKTVRTVMPDAKWVGGDPCFATRRTTQP